MREGESLEDAYTLVLHAMQDCFEEAAKHLDDHADGYEHAAKLEDAGPSSTDMVTSTRVIVNENLAHTLREKAIQIRLKKEGL